MPLMPIKGGTFNIKRWHLFYIKINTTLRFLML